jgi:hypothetical protein
MHEPIKVKSPNNSSKWQMGFNSAFKGFVRSLTFNRLLHDCLICLVDYCQHAYSERTRSGPLLDKDKRRSVSQTSRTGERADMGSVTAYNRTEHEAGCSGLRIFQILSFLPHSLCLFISSC